LVNTGPESMNMAFGVRELENDYVAYWGYG